jgi:hypothetical protein
MKVLTMWQSSSSLWKLSCAVVALGWSVSSVDAANTAPVSRGIANVTANEDGPATTINLWAAFDDAEDRDPKLKFVVAGNTNPTLVLTSINALTGQLVLNYRANQNGVAQLLVRCTDTGGQSAQASFRVTVNAVPDAPTLSPIPVQQAKVDLVFTLNVKGQDGDLPNDVLRYTLDAASIARGTTITTVSGSGSIRWTPRRGSEGQTFPVTVTVFDRNNQSASQTFQIQVQQTVVITNPPPPPAPPPPLVAVNDRTNVAVGQSVNLTNLIRANDLTNGRPTRILQVRFPFYVNPYEILQTSSTNAGVSLTYTNRGYTGTQVINYVIQDDLGQVDSGWLTIQSGGYVGPSAPAVPNPAVVNITMRTDTAPGTIIGFVSTVDPDGGRLPRFREADPNLFPELKTHPQDAMVFRVNPFPIIPPADGLAPFAVDSSSGAIRYLGGVTLADRQIYIRNVLIYDGLTGSPTSNNFNPSFGKIVVRVVPPP